MRRHVLGSVCLATVLATAACSDPQTPEDARPVVVVTIFPVADLVASLAGDAADVQTLLPSRASPSTWEATPSQVRALSGAVGYVTVGGGLDDWLEDAADGPGSLLHLRIVDGPELAAMGTTDHEHGSGNPHVWLDPILVRDHVLPRVADFLTEILPSDRRAIMDRASAWTDSMTALDGEIRDLLVGSHERRFIATHDAWSHFAARYRLQSLGSLYERPGHEPSARGLADLIEGARGAGITTVLTEPQLATTAARAIAAELGAEIGVVDPLGGPGLQGRERYCDLMRFNARSFAAALAAR